MFFIISTAGVGFLEIVSGVYLVRSVLRIRAVFKEHDAEDQIDGKIMLLHLSAFCVYLVSIIVFYAATVLYYTGEISKDAFEIYSLFFIIATFLSAILLAIIFWDVGRKEPTDREASMIQTETFDDDDEMNARIWNRFMRRDRASKLGYSAFSTNSKTGVST